MTASTQDKEKWDEIMRRVAHQKESQQDAMITTSRMRYLGGDSHSLLLPTKLNAGFKAVSMTDTSRRQLLSHIGIPEAYFNSVEQRNPTLAKDLFNDHLQQDNKLFWRFRDDRLRAVLTERTPSTDNNSVVEAINDVLSVGNVDFVIRSVQINDEKFYLKILFDNEYRDQTGIVEGNYLKIGVVLRSSEVHHGSLSIKPFMYRWSCTNDAVVSSANRFDTTNFGISTQELKENIATVVATARISANDIVSNALSAQAKTISRPMRVLQAIGNQIQMPKSDVKKLITAYRNEPMPTQYGIAQALTSFAQKFALDKRDKLETVGGMLLDQNNWRGDMPIINL
jgi:hypothetical protein